MYRKYLQEFTAEQDKSEQQNSSSPEAIFPDTHLIVGDAHLKAARAGATHREPGTSSADCEVHNRSSSTPSIKKGINGDVLNRSASAKAVRKDINGGILKKSSSAAPVKEHVNGDVVNRSSAPTSVTKNILKKSSSSSPVSSQNNGGILNKSSPTSRRRRDKRRINEVVQLEDIVSPSTTPEFRRRPKHVVIIEPTETQHRISTPSQDSWSPQSIRTSPISPRPSPMRVWDANGVYDPPGDEVILTKPVVEASRTTSVMYPVSHNDLISRAVPDTPSGQGHTQDMIKVLPVSNGPFMVDERLDMVENGGQRMGGKGTQHQRFSSLSHGEVSSWRGNTPVFRLAKKRVVTVGQSTPSSCYSLLCCAHLPVPSSSPSSSSTPSTRR